MKKHNPKPPPYRPPTRGLSVLTLFIPPDRIAIYRLSGKGLQLVRMLHGARIESGTDAGKEYGS